MSLTFGQKVNIKEIPTEDLKRIFENTKDLMCASILSNKRVREEIVRQFTEGTAPKSLFQVWDAGRVRNRLAKMVAYGSELATRGELTREDVAAVIEAAQDLVRFDGWLKRII